jgi:hypothetical protein
MTERQVFYYNVRAALDRCTEAPKSNAAYLALLWVVSHRYPPHQGDLALRNGLRPEQLPEACRRQKDLTKCEHGL